MNCWSKKQYKNKGGRERESLEVALLARLYVPWQRTLILRKNIFFSKYFPSVAVSPDSYCYHGRGR